MSGNTPDEHGFVDRTFRIDHVINHCGKALFVAFGIELIKISRIAFLIEIGEDVADVRCRIQIRAIRFGRY